MEAKKTPDRLNKLYPKVDEAETPLPRTWSSRDKFAYLALTHNNLRVHYKGSGKNHKDAASVRTAHYIPSTCGIYYFEVQLVSKGRDGYIGIGLCTNNSNLNKLPGWEKHSYGYHADDGCLFNSSGSGEKYGPTFSTGDTVGCGYNMVDKHIFFTKNGVHLGPAFTGIATSAKLYPMIGLQTPGELIEANFGSKPFLYDFDSLLEEQRWCSRESVEQFVFHGNQGAWQSSLHKIVLGYLVHCGYSSTAKVFAESSGLVVEEEEESILNRKKMQQLILAGHMSEALQLVHTHYPGLLETHKELLLHLKCRQFVERLVGNDRPQLSASISPPVAPLMSPTPSPLQQRTAPQCTHTTPSSNGTTVASNGLVRSSGNGAVEELSDSDDDDDDEMVVSEDRMELGKSPATGDDLPILNLPMGGDKGAIQQLLLFGRQVKQLYTELSEQVGVAKREELKKMLQDTFSLLGYTDPHDSPVCHLLDEQGREVICTALNSALLASQGLPEQTSLEFALGHCQQLVQWAGQHRVGGAVFIGVDHVIAEQDKHLS